MTPLDGELDDDLSEDELMELERFLSSPGLIDSSMDVFGLDGFFAAILCAPELAVPEEWMPWVWDMERGEVVPTFENAAEEERILDLVMRHYDSVAREMLHPPENSEGFAPLFEEGDVDAASAWCSGFLAGVQLDRESWSDLMLEKPKWFDPILGLGLEEEEDAPRPRRSQLERWTRDVAPMVAKIFAFGFAGREDADLGSGAVLEASAQAPGRNDTCPCGSGKKFKRCCGVRPADVN